jgi:hypothetical protein
MVYYFSFQRLNNTITMSIYLWPYSPLLDLGRFFSLLMYTQSVGLLGCGFRPSQGRSLPTHMTAQTQNTRIQTSMPHMGFEATIPASERAKTIHALDSAATVIGILPCRELRTVTIRVVRIVRLRAYMILHQFDITVSSVYCYTNPRLV